MSGTKKDSPLRVRLPTPMKRAYDQLAEQRGESVAVVVREALSEYYVNHITQSNARERAQQLMAQDFPATKKAAPKAGAARNRRKRAKP